MMPRTGKRLFIIMTAGIAWGLVFFTGCDEAGKAPPPRPKVVSKQIVQPGPADGSKKADTPGTPSKVKKDPAPSVSKAGPASGGSNPVTEAQVKREQAEARTQAEAQSLARAETGTPLFRSRKEYDFKDRVDPFIPLISEKKEPVPAAGTKEEIPKRVLTPLEKMELSQIKLVAVLQSSKGTIAMVEEASGKGYEVRVGTYVGRNGGRVSAINSDGVLVKEFYTDYRGKRRERVEEIKFHKNEGGE